MTQKSNTKLVLFLLIFCVILLAGIGFWLVKNNTGSSAPESDYVKAHQDLENAPTKTNKSTLLSENKEPPISPVQFKTDMGRIAKKPSGKINAADLVALTPKGDITFEAHIKPFLNQYCVDCHGPTKQKANRRYDNLSFPIQDTDALVDYQDILDLINLGEMPPEDELQPSNDEKFKVINWLTKAIALAQKARQSQGGETVLRRMNRREYLATVGDLLRMNMVGFDPTVTFPDELKAHHLDNQGHALLTSGYLLQQYIYAAEMIIEKALPNDLTRPPSRTWIAEGNFQTASGFEGAIFLEMNEKGIPPEIYRKLRRYQPEKDPKGALKKRLIREGKLRPSDFEQMVHDAKKMPTIMKLYEFPGADTSTGNYGYIPEVSDGVPVDGYYDISLTIQPKHRTKATFPSRSGADLNEPMIFAIVPGDIRQGKLGKPQSVEPILYQKDIWGDETMTDITARVYLHKGQTPRFNWRNGGRKTRISTVSWARNQMRQRKIRIERKRGFTKSMVQWASTRIRIPHMRLTDIQMRGPITHDSDLATIKFLLGGTEFDASQNKANLRRILPEAFRRPVTSDEVHGVMQFIRAREASGRSPYEAYKDGLKAVLCSPSFLYLEENPTDEGTISQEALASRLSYFLWSSMPDDQLMQKAKSGKLTSDTVLSEEVDRMLKDPKSNRFINGLLDGWLTIDQLRSVLPDRDDYHTFFVNDLPTLMREETVQFTRHILDTNRPIQDFIDCNYTFVNQQLASHYQLETKVKGAKFRKVELAANSPRGGLLGHGSILTVTANGVETSPVIRGMWLLENLLGTPPPPPPPDVEPLDPDIRGAKTMRERLQKHSTDPTCAECHRKIDPLGFALENFGPVGEFRTHYRKSEGGGKISAHGRMPNNMSFNTFQDFKRILLKDEEKFARALTEKLFSYALGRPVEITDRPEIDAILSDLQSQGYGFKYLITRVITSPAFKRS